VIRRELRQLEGGWYSTEKLQRSKQRVDKLGYFSEVAVDTVAVPGVPDQVDVNVKVVERPTGNLLFGVGYSTAEGVIFSGSVSQNNLFGTGNGLALQLNTGNINTVYALSFTRPYITDDGMGFGIDLYRRDVDATDLSVSTYATSTLGLGMRFSVPITETDTINYGLAAERTTIELGDDPAQRYVDFVDEFGEDNTELRFYRTNYEIQWFIPVRRENVLQLSGRIGYADGYDAKPLPFYKNFYLGGVGTVRGYETASIGPKDENGDALGGPALLVGNAEFFFPFPGLEKDRSVRLSAFFDVGSVSDTFDAAEARASVGLALSWFSPVGPLKISYGWALNAQDDDDTQPFQFSVGTVF
jgi:outer membrane protein insertion porin family